MPMQPGPGVPFGSVGPAYEEPQSRVAAPRPRRALRGAVIGAAIAAGMAMVGTTGAAAVVVVASEQGKSAVAETKFRPAGEQRPEWAAIHAASLKSRGPSGVAEYGAIVVGRSIEAGEAIIDLEYRVPGENASKRTQEPLSLVAALDPTICEEFVDSTPEQELERLLPDGTRVLVIDDDGGSGDEAFLHVLPKGAWAPTVLPPDAAVNEDLVRTGVWTPQIAHDGRWAVSPWDNEKVEWRLDGQQVLTATQATYAPHIIEAANGSLAGTEQGEACAVGAAVAVAANVEETRKRQQDEKKQREEAAASAAAADALRKRQAEDAMRAAVTAEMERRAAEQRAAAVPSYVPPAYAPPYVPPAYSQPYAPSQGGSTYRPDTTLYGTACGPGDRDGDGDGVCNEHR